jgi:hypothetical protein
VPGAFLGLTYRSAAAAAAGQPPGLREGFDAASLRLLLASAQAGAAEAAAVAAAQQ